ncbi:MAG: recombinase, partial [Candidatus Lutacidiplasmatales archaeon]
NTPQNTLMFRAVENPRFVATPDGIVVGAGGSIVLVQAKTTNKEFRTIPRGYIRQCLWEQYVIGADRTLFVWEVHEGFRPLDMEPQSVWIDAAHYPDELEQMLAIGGDVLAALDQYDAFAASLTH